MNVPLREGGEEDLDVADSVQKVVQEENDDDE
jgi:hypothetical protein